MAEFKAAKVVGDLPSILEQDTVYFVRAGEGFDLYVTNGVGETVAYSLNIDIPSFEQMTVLEGLSGTSTEGRTISASVLRELLGNTPVIELTGEHTLVAKDAGMNLVTSYTTHLTSGKFKVGDVLTISNDSASPIVMQTAAGVTLQFEGEPSTGWAEIGLNGVATLTQIREDVWRVRGAEVTVILPIAKRPNTDGTGFTYYATDAAEPGEVYEFEGENYYTVVDLDELKALLAPLKLEGAVDSIGIMGPVGEVEITANRLITTYLSSLAEAIKSAGPTSKYFDKDISGWDTSNVTSFEGALEGCLYYNQPLSGWDISKAITISRILNSCALFNQPIGMWDTSSVIDFSGALENCESFDQLIEWDTSKGKNLGGMLSGCSTFNQSLSSLRFDEAISLNGFLNECTSFNQEWSNVHLPKVEAFGGVMVGCSSFNSNMTDWTFGKFVVIQAGLFAGCVSLKDADLSRWTFEAGANLENMFIADAGIGGGEFNCRLTGWRLNGPTTIDNFLNGQALFNQPLDGLISRHVTSMDGMLFDCASFNGTVRGWDVRSVAVADSVFSGCSEFNQPMGKLRWLSCWTMGRMYLGCDSFNQDLSGWCVPLIAEAPYNFDTNAYSWTLPRPTWGAPC